MSLYQVNLKHYRSLRSLFNGLNLVSDSAIMRVIPTKPMSIDDSGKPEMMRILNALATSKSIPIKKEKEAQQCLQTTTHKTRRSGKVFFSAA